MIYSPPALAACFTGTVRYFWQRASHWLTVTMMSSAKGNSSVMNPDHGEVQTHPVLPFSFCDSFLLRTRSVRCWKQQENYGTGIILRQLRPWPVSLSQRHQSRLVSCYQSLSLQPGWCWQPFMCLLQRGSRAWHPRSSPVWAPGHWQVQLLRPVQRKPRISLLQHLRKLLLAMFSLRNILYRMIVPS